jgi:phosphoribosylanthranilate isomerase
MLLVEGRSEKGFGGTGESWNYQGLSSATWPLPLLLSGGLSPDRVGEAIRSLCPRIPFGVDVSSGVEFSPGRKDEKKVIDFIQRVRRSEEKS